MQWRYVSVVNNPFIKWHLEAFALLLVAQGKQMKYVFTHSQPNKPKLVQRHYHCYQFSSACTCPPCNHYTFPLLDICHHLSLLQCLHKYAKWQIQRIIQTERVLWRSLVHTAQLKAGWIRSFCSGSRPIEDGQDYIQGRKPHSLSGPCFNAWPFHSWKHLSGEIKIKIVNTEAILCKGRPSSCIFIKTAHLTGH